MKRMKKIILLLVVLLLLTSCGQTEEPEATATPTAAPVVTAAPTPVAPEDIPLQETPSSDCFSAIGYDAETETLVVIFRRNNGGKGAKYAYYDFPAYMWERFTAADSLGTFLNKEIKGYYEYEKLS